MMDAILFSANPHIVDIDDVAKHLSNHETLYWTVGFPFSKATKETLSFPIYGFIHVSGHGQVEYRTLVHDIVPFSPSHFANPSLKPAPWREEYKANPNERPLKSSLVMTEIVQFSFDTYQFEKYGGGLIKRPPQRYVRVIPPNQPQGSTPEKQSRVSIAESNLESFVVHQLDTIETGLRLVKRQLSTPAGRLDLLCQDLLGNYVVIELKKTLGTDQVVGQTLRYMGWAKREYPNSKIRGIIIASQIDDTLQYALDAMPDIVAKKFKVSIE